MQTDADLLKLPEDLQDNVSAYPVPPLEYFRRFFADVPEPADTGAEAAVSGSAGDRDALDDPVERSQPGPYPAPPPVPEDLSVESFGCLLTPKDHIIRELEDQGIERLGSEKSNRQELLKRLMWSLLSKFFEILECLIKNPHSEDRLELTTDLQTIFINFHHTVNLYRLPQAYESLTELLKYQTLRNIKQTESLLAGMTSTLELFEQSRDTKMEPEEMLVDGLPAFDGDEAEHSISIDVIKTRKEVAVLQDLVDSIRRDSETMAKNPERNFDEL